MCIYTRTSTSAPSSLSSASNRWDRLPGLTTGRTHLYTHTLSLRQTPPSHSLSPTADRLPPPRTHTRPTPALLPLYMISHSNTHAHIYMHEHQRAVITSSAIHRWVLSLHKILFHFKGALQLLSNRSK